MATQTAETTPDANRGEATIRNTARGAALEYAEHGWPVLPGSAWNGRRYQVPGTNKTTDGVRPTVPRNYATTHAGTITGWWSADDKLVPTVLLRSGLAFDVLSVARSLAEIALQHPAFHNNAGPVVFRPDQGRAYFIVTPGEIPPSGFGGEPGEITLLESGSWILVPPARTGPGVNVVWRVMPKSIEWKVARSDVVRDVLKVVAQGRSLLPPTH